MGHVVRPSDEKEPHKVAWIQCVGSRNTNRCDNGYCSSVCCMYAIKQMLITAEHAKGQPVEQTVFYMDMRSPGKEFERYYESAKAKGIRFLRSRPHTIEPGDGGNGVSMRYVTEAGELKEEAFDLAVLSVGLEPAKESRQLAETFGIQLDSYGFAQSSNLSPVHSTRPGVFVTGAFQAPKAIPRSVTQASAAAAAAAEALHAVRGTLTRQKSYPAERDVSGQAAAHRCLRLLLRHQYRRRHRCERPGRIRQDPAPCDPGGEQPVHLLGRYPGSDRGPGPRTQFEPDRHRRLHPPDP